MCIRRRGRKHVDSSSEQRRLWSDGHGIYHIATIGERLFAGFFDWVFVIFVGGALGATATVNYVYATSELVDDLDWYMYGDAEAGGILWFEPLSFVSMTLVHIASAIIVARRGESPGYRALKLKVRRDNLESLGWRRCLLRKFIGSPGLTLPYLLLVLLVPFYYCLSILETRYDWSLDLFGILSDPVLGIWSLGLTIYWIATPILVAVNHIQVNRDAKGRMPHDVLLDIVLVQDRILSTNRAAFPSTGREPVERWDQAVAQREATMREGLNYETASAWRSQLMAGLMDGIITMGWILLVSIVLATVMTVVREYSFILNLAALLLYFGFWILLVVMIIRYVVTAFRIASKGDTVGHRMFGLRIVTVNGKRLSRRRVLVRQFFGSPLLFAYVFPVILLHLVAGMFNLGLLGIAVTSWVYGGWILSLVLVIANHVWIAMDDRGRGWHDRIAGTVVLHNRPVTSKADRLASHARSEEVA